MFRSNTTRYSLKKEFPGAYRIQAVEGGFMVFITASGYKTWKNQK